MSDEIPDDIWTAAKAVFYPEDRVTTADLQCLPMTIARAILAERERWKPAVTYFERYCQDEADDDDFPERFRQQHEDAKAFRSVVEASK